MYASLVGKMMCNEYKREHKGHLMFKALFDKYPSIAYILVLFGVPLISLAMVFGLVMMVMYPISVLLGWV